jgi:tetratricopeptide (TPR) repeat protein
MIIDNADDMRLFFPQADNLSKSRSNNEDSLGQFIPECSHGTILITTRNMQVGSRLMKGKRPIEVGKMDENESIQLLRQGLQGDESTEDLLQLSSRLEFLPLALVQAAAFIQENSITVNDYLELLDGSDQDLIDLLSEDFETVGRDSDTPRAVAQTWMLSFQQIEREYPFAGELLSLMSLFDRQAIPLEFLEFYSEEKKRAESNIRMQLVKALGVLKAFCFIRAEKGGDHNMHRLVQLVTRTWLIRKGIMAPFARDALLSVSEFYPYGHFEKVDTCTAYLAHAFSVLDLQSVESDEDRLLRASMLHRVGGFFLFQGRYADAEKLQREGTKIRTELLGEEHLETLVLMLDLSYCLQSQARYEEAEKLAVSVLETWKRLHGEEHYKTLDAMYALASSYYDQDKIEEAKRLFTHVFEIRKRVLGEDHEDTLRAMSGLALTLEEAEQVEIHKHIIKAKTKADGADHPGTLTSKSNLAMTLYTLGEGWEAEELETEVLETRKRVLGEEHPDTLVSMMNLGQFWTTLGRDTADIKHLYPDVDLFGDAKRMLEECVQLQTKLLGPDHPDTLKSHTRLEECQEAMELADHMEVNTMAVELNSQVEL